MSQQSLTVCLIAANTVLPLAVDSVEGGYDELVVAASCQQEAAAEIARQYGADLLSAAHPADIGALVRLSLAQVRTDWVLVLMGDEFANARLVALLQEIRSLSASAVEIDSFWVRRRWLAPWSTVDCIKNHSHRFDYACRVFRRKPELHFSSATGELFNGLQRQRQFPEEACLYTLHLTLHSLVHRQQAMYHRYLRCGQNLRDALPHHYLSDVRTIQTEALPQASLNRQVLEQLLLLSPVNCAPSETSSLAVAMPHPRFVIDGIFFQMGQAGVARLWSSVFEEWSRSDFAAHILILDRGGTAPKFPQLRYRNFPTLELDRVNQQSQMIEEICRVEQADVFCSTFYTSPLTTPSVSMVYDFIPEVLGWDYRDAPLQPLRAQAISQAQTFIAISDSTAKDLLALHPQVQPEQVHVTSCGVSESFHPASIDEQLTFRQHYGINQKYFLLAGARRKHKNALLFFCAFVELENREDFAIVCAGGEALENEFLTMLGEQRVYTLKLDDDELRSAYSGATALVYPSLYEGFGLPILEAMACGCPVITCDNSSIPEVAGSAALYVREADVAGMLTALRQVQHIGERQRLSAAGLERASQFRWTHVAEAIRDVLLQASLPWWSSLSERNWVLFPDWQADGDALLSELAECITAITGPCTLLVDMTAEVPAEAEAALGGLLAQLCLINSLDLETIGVQVVPIGPLSAGQWRVLGPRLTGKLRLEQENIHALLQSGLQELMVGQADLHTHERVGGSRL